MDQEIQNAFKINRLILDVLNPVLQDWIQNNHSRSIWDVILHSTNPFLNDTQKILTNYRKKKKSKSIRF